MRPNARTGLLLTGVLGTGLFLAVPVAALANDSPSPSESPAASTTPSATSAPTVSAVPTVTVSPTSPATEAPDSATPSAAATPSASASPTKKPPYKCVVTATPHRPAHWGDPATVTFTATGDCAGATVVFRFWIKNVLFKEKVVTLTGPGTKTLTLPSPLESACERVRAVLYASDAGSDLLHYIRGDDNLVCPQAVPSSGTPTPSSPTPSPSSPSPSPSSPTPSPSTPTPTPSASVSPSPSSGSLPFTGTDSAALGLTALGLVAAGLAMVRIGRSPRG